ncbi:hypothetical protein ABZU94_13885 [Streptomyces mirabilis]|uniref:hypothetical protein n=1 Tax=Streptomyces sp. NPDC005388 TaxID=3156717 RepID=UPI0033BE3BF9
MAVARYVANQRANDAKPRERAEQAQTETVTIAAAGLYVAAAGYDEALRHPNPVATLDSMCDGLHEIAPDIAKVINTKAGAEFAEALRVATVAPLWAFTAIERARAEAGDGHGYLFDYLADGLRRGADPDVVRKAALAAPSKIHGIADQATE